MRKPTQRDSNTLEDNLDELLAMTVPEPQANRHSRDRILSHLKQTQRELYGSRSRSPNGWRFAAAGLALAAASLLLLLWVLPPNQDQTEDFSAISQSMEITTGNAVGRAVLSNASHVRESIEVRRQIFCSVLNTKLDFFTYHVLMLLTDLPIDVRDAIGDQNKTLGRLLNMFARCAPP